MESDKVELGGKLGQLGGKAPLPPVYRPAKDNTEDRIRKHCDESNEVEKSQCNEILVSSIVDNDYVIKTT
jgi:hypothetical protein